MDGEIRFLWHFFTNTHINAKRSMHLHCKKYTATCTCVVVNVTKRNETNDSKKKIEMIYSPFFYLFVVFFSRFMLKREHVNIFRTKVINKLCLRICFFWIEMARVGSMLGWSMLTFFILSFFLFIPFDEPKMIATNHMFMCSIRLFVLFFPLFCVYTIFFLCWVSTTILLFHSHSRD